MMFNTVVIDQWDRIDPTWVVSGAESVSKARHASYMYNYNVHPNSKYGTTSPHCILMGDKNGYSLQRLACQGRIEYM